MKTVKHTYWFLSGQCQSAPKWFNKLPRFCSPIYIGDDCFRWFGLVVKVKYPMAGETLFMAWRRRFKIWLVELRHDGLLGNLIHWYNWFLAEENFEPVSWIMVIVVAGGSALLWWLLGQLGLLV